LGSLAHGGFSPVSDIDFALVMKGPVKEEDISQISKIKSHILSSQLPFSDKLSIFWAPLKTLKTSNSLSKESSLGRFPPADILDLIDFGNLLDGRDIRKEIRRPEKQEVIIGCAHFAMGKLGGDYLSTMIRNAEDLFQKQNAYAISKCILWPVRMLYTGRTGLVGPNSMAVDHYIGNALSKNNAELVMKGLEWRFGLPPFGPSNVQLFRDNIHGLYLEFIQDYQKLLEMYSQPELMKQWKSCFSSGFEKPVGPWNQ